MAITTTETLAAATSGLATDAAFTAASALPGTVAQIGNTTNAVALVRFDTSAITETDRVLQARMLLTFEAVGAGQPGVSVWGANFGAAIALADARLTTKQTANTIDAEDHRMEIGIGVQPGSTALTCTVAIPTRYVKKGGNSDFEIRAFILSGALRIAPSAANQTRDLTLKSTEATRPKLTVVHCTRADIVAGDAADYLPIGMGSETYVAFGVEGAQNKPVKGSFLVTRVNDTFSPNDTKLFSQGVRDNRTGPYMVGAGVVDVAGSISFELPFEKWTKLLLGFFAKESTTGPVSVDGVDIYTHTFKPTANSNLKTFTIIKRISPRYLICGFGMLIQDATFDGAIGDWVRASLNFDGLNYGLYSQEDVGLLDDMLLRSSAGYATGQAATFEGARMLVDSTVDPGLVQNFTLSLSNNGGKIQGFNRKRTGYRMFARNLGVGLTFNQVFADAEMCRKYLSIAQETETPANSGSIIESDEIAIEIAGPLGPASEELIFTIPKAIYSAAPISLNGEDPTTLSCTVIGCHDETEATNLIVVLRNAEPGTWFTDDSDDRITVLPKEYAYP